MYAACVHGDRDDRMAAGSANISNERFRGEVVTSCGIDVSLSCSSRHRYPCPHFLRESLLIARWPNVGRPLSWLLCKRKESK